MQMTYENTKIFDLFIYFGTKRVLIFSPDKYFIFLFFFVNIQLFF